MNDRCAGAGAGRCAAAAATVLAVLATLGGCGIVQQLSVDDKNSPSAAVRGVWRPGGGRSGPGIEVGYEGYRAKGAQPLGPGEVAFIEGQTITGPDTLNHRATVQLGHVAYNHRFAFGPHFELDVIGGIGSLDAKLRTETASGAPPVQLRQSGSSAYGGIATRWRFNDAIAIEARLAGMPDVVNDVYDRRTELAVVLNPAPAIGLRLGWSRREAGIDFNRENSWTRLQLNAQGPFASLQLEF